MNNSATPRGAPRVAQFDRGERRPGTSRRVHRALSLRPDRFGLSAREHEVMEHLVKGRLYKEIADHMNVSYGAVHKLQHKIFRKLRVANRTEAAVKWLAEHRG